MVHEEALRSVMVVVMIQYYTYVMIGSCDDCAKNVPQSRKG